MRILVADDNADGREALSLLLTHQGHAVTTTPDGPSALSAFDEVRPEVGILDIGMPGLNGYDVARRVRQSELHVGLMLIALSGWGRPEDKALAAAAGFDHHFTKPVDIRRLFEILEARAQG